MKRVIGPLAALTLTVAFGCGDSGETGLQAGASDDSSDSSDTGDGFVCPVECSRCEPFLRDACESAADACDEPVCCEQVQLAFDCVDAPPPRTDCPFDCSQCVATADSCRQVSAMCANIGGPSRRLCCDAVAATFSTCPDDPGAGEACEEVDCTTCSEPMDEIGCEVAVDACENSPQPDFCCRAIPGVFTSCGGGGGGVCDFDCSTCVPDVAVVCRQVELACEQNPGTERLCCQQLETVIGPQCAGGGGGGSCDVPCERCTNPTQRQACELAENTCGTFDPDRAAVCCAELEAQLPVLCGL
jgi:hypothetical protein